MHSALAPAHFVHELDPVLIAVGSFRLYYYGLAYTLGFAGLHFWLSLRGSGRGWTRRAVCDFSIILSLSVLLFGRAFEIVFYEWGYFKTHVGELFSFWKGGMASHGVLLGSVVGIWLFGRIQHRRFLEVADEVAMPAALFLAVGRIGNFVNGEIVGTVADLPWAVKFPGVDGFRHPVALYESLKNLALIPILIAVRRRARSGDGRLTAHFILWYGLLRLFTDYFREYGTTYLGIGAGQYFNLVMALAGGALLLAFSRGYRDLPAPVALTLDDRGRGSLLARRMLLSLILFSYLLIPSSWSRGGLEYYRSRSVIRAPSQLLLQRLPEQVDAEQDRRHRPPLVEPGQRYVPPGVEQQDEADADQHQAPGDRSAELGHLEVVGKIDLLLAGKVVVEQRGPAHRVDDVVQPEEGQKGRRQGDQLVEIARGEHRDQRGHDDRVREAAHVIADVDLTEARHAGQETGQRG